VNKRRDAEQAAALAVDIVVVMVIMSALAWLVGWCSP